jgi:formate C-acetyltransferase
MVWDSFWKDREFIDNQYNRIVWNEASLSPEEFETQALDVTESLESRGSPKALRKAELFAWVMDHAPIAVDPHDFFQDHLWHGNVVQKQRQHWIDAVMGEMPELQDRTRKAYSLGVYAAGYDFGHTVPDWNDVLSLGFPGLLRRIQDTRRKKEAEGPLREKNRVFYEASETVYAAALRYVDRLAKICLDSAAREPDPVFRERLLLSAQNLRAIASHEPQTLYQALQTAYIYHILQEEVEGERLRSLGGLDRLYEVFYRNDLQGGRYTREELKTLLRYFFQKFHALTGDQLFGEPVYIGGTLPDGSCAVSDFTELIVETFDELSIANPKFHVRISKNTPRSFIKKICDCIRRGNSSFVFINDECAIPMMQKVGVTLEEAREFVPIGCYEPGIMGREVACTGNGGFSMPKTVELALHNGIDPLSGERMGAETGDPASFDTFEKLLEAVKNQQRELIHRGVRDICELEKRYMEMNPSPLFSGTLIECVEQGMDAYAGGAKYNNSSFYAYGNGTMADELAAIDKLVYENREMTLADLTGILDADWEGHESLRLRTLRDEEKWGNNRDLPDWICAEIAGDCAEAVNSQSNARGGRFKAAMFTIDHHIYWGSKAGASADGRRKGEALSKNLGASLAMDRGGVTALIRSVTRLDHELFPNGSVLDIVLHPTAVAGEDGLEAFTALIESYMTLGGFAVHGNVFDARTLREAQAHPEEYANIQVRVCGWNVYFVNLSRREQDMFILQAENAAAS